MLDRHVRGFSATLAERHRYMSTLLIVARVLPHVCSIEFFSEILADY